MVTNKDNVSGFKCHLDSTRTRFTVKPKLLPKPKNIELKTSPYKVKHEFPSVKSSTNTTNEKTVDSASNQMSNCELNKSDTNTTIEEPNNDSDVNSNISKLEVPDNVISILENNVIDSENNNNSINNKINDNDSDLEIMNESAFDGELNRSTHQAIDDVEIQTEDEKSFVQKFYARWVGSFGKGKHSKPPKMDLFYDNRSGNGHSDNDTDSHSSLDEKPNENVELDETLPVENIEAEEIPPKAKSLRIIEELISTEKIFIDVLKLLCKTFVSFIEQAGGDNQLIPSTDLSKIISPLPQLLSLNEDLLQDMEKRLENWMNNPKIADVIVKKGPFLKLYSTYIQQFEGQCNLLDEYCQKYPRFQKYVKYFEASEVCKKLTIKHYMLKPIQRIPQYKLLLQSYLENQTKDSIDYEDTELALNIVSDVANHANKSIERGVCF